MTTATIDQPRTTSATAGKLTRAAVLAAARRLAERNGIDGLSMRRLAEELGVSTMAAYRHIGGKDDIVDTLVSGLLEDGVPFDADGGRLYSGGVDVDEVTGRVVATWTHLDKVPGLRLVLDHRQEHVKAWAERATRPVDWLTDDQLEALRAGLITALIGSPTIETVRLTAAALVDYQSGPRGGSGA